MQIDFHHAVTYAAARLAEFPAEDAAVIAYAAQYVDDAVNSGTIHFRNKAMYSRISSAHKMLDYRNFKELANHFTWVPFHFLPGNGGKKAGDNPEGGFAEKLVCYPGSDVAREMVAACIKDRRRPYSLHRLGITMHVLADTFAHQGFAGINHPCNEAADLKKQEEDDGSLLEKLADYFSDLFDSAANKVISNAFPLGHGAVLDCPDLPFLKWEYVNGSGETIKRDNTEIFMDAVESIHSAMFCYRMKNPEYILNPEDHIKDTDLEQIRTNFLNFDDDDGETRHKQWIDSIDTGVFSFAQCGQEEISYIPKGTDSWKHLALDTRREVETKHERYRFSPDFMDSHWKLFHDALQVHRIDVIRNILPRYGICAA